MSFSTLVWFLFPGLNLLFYRSKLVIGAWLYWCKCQLEEMCDAYLTYCSGVRDSIRLLVELKRTAAFAQFLKGSEKTSLTLSAFIKKPIEVLTALHLSAIKSCELRRNLMCFEMHRHWCAVIACSTSKTWFLVFRKSFHTPRKNTRITIIYVKFFSVCSLFVFNNKT